MFTEVQNAKFNGNGNHILVCTIVLYIDTVQLKVRKVKVSYKEMHMDCGVTEEVYTV